MSNYSTEIETAELDDTGLSKNAGWLTVYHAHPQTAEYLSASYEYLMAGVGLPAHSYPDAPVLPPVGQALRRRVGGQGWEHVADYRGQTAYHTETRQPSVVEVIGELQEGFTLLAPATDFDSWSGKKWVTDKTAMQAAEIQAAQQIAQQELATRQAEATSHIQALSDAVELQIATEQEQAALTAWKTYRVLLSRIDINTAPDIDWPTAPQEQAQGN